MKTLNIFRLLMLLSFPILTMANSLELRVGNFFPVSNLLAETYKHGGIEFEIEACFRNSNEFRTWVNLNVFHRKGNSIGLINPSTIAIYPLSAGVNFDIPLANNIALYLGVGGSCSFLNINDNSILATQHIKKTAWGAVGKTGVIFLCTKRLFLDLYADYYYTKAFLKGNSRNVGGFRVGLGLGLNY